LRVTDIERKTGVSVQTKTIEVCFGRLPSGHVEWKSFFFPPRNGACGDIHVQPIDVGANGHHLI